MNYTTTPNKNSQNINKTVQEELELKLEWKIHTEAQACFHLASNSEASLWTEHPTAT